MPLRGPAGEGRVLDFDIENRPLSYWQPDRPTAEITAIASCWVNDLGSMEVLLLGQITIEEMLGRFVERYNQADLVTGHFIRVHDLPIINGALMEQGLPTLRPKLTCDTKLDMFKKADIPATQEYLSEMMGLPVEKVHMTQAKWRESNRLTPKGLEYTKKRVAGDVYQHIMMRESMLHHGMLRGPRMWNPGGGEADVTLGRKATYSSI